MRGSEGTVKFSLPLLLVVPRISSLRVQGGNLLEREVRGRERSEEDVEKDGGFGVSAWEEAAAVQLRSPPRRRVCLACSSSVYRSYRHAYLTLHLTR